MGTYVISLIHLHTGLKYRLLQLLSAPHKGAKTLAHSTLCYPSPWLPFPLPTVLHNKPQARLASPPAISLLGSRHLPTSSVKDNTQYILRANLPKGIQCFQDSTTYQIGYTHCSQRDMHKTRMYFSGRLMLTLKKKNSTKMSYFSTFNSAAT